MKKSFYLFSLVFAFNIGLSKAQTHFTIAAQVGVPTGEFKESTDAIGGGIRTGLYFPFAPNVPVYFGIDFGYLLYGSNSLDINQNLQVTAGTTVISTIPVNLRVTTNNNLINTFAVFRFKAPLPMVQPYIDGLAGFNYIYTRTKITDNTTNRIFTSNQETNVINARTTLQDFVFSYGGGVGIMVKFSNLALDVRGAYILGGKAKYYDQAQTNNWTVQFTGSSGTFNPQNPQDIAVNPDANPKESATDMIFINFGLAINF